MKESGSQIREGRKTERGRSEGEACSVASENFQCCLDPLFRRVKERCGVGLICRLTANPSTLHGRLKEIIDLGYDEVCGYSGGASRSPGVQSNARCAPGILRSAQQSAPAAFKNLFTP